MKPAIQVRLRRLYYLRSCSSNLPSKFGPVVYPGRSQQRAWLRPGRFLVGRQATLVRLLHDHARGSQRRGRHGLERAGRTPVVAVDGLTTGRPRRATRILYAEDVSPVTAASRLGQDGNQQSSYQQNAAGNHGEQLLCSLVSRAGAGNLPCKAAAVSRRFTHGIDAACEDVKSMRRVQGDSTTVCAPEPRIACPESGCAGNEGGGRRQGGPTTMGRVSRVNLRAVLAVSAGSRPKRGAEEAVLDQLNFNIIWLPPRP